MKYKKYRKPFVLFSGTSNGRHPHVILGESNGKYVSMNLTHCSSVPGHSVLKMPNNPQQSFLVTDSLYCRDKSQYFKTAGSWSFSSKDKWVCRRFAKRARRFSS
jgi:hypothetical protein